MKLWKRNAVVAAIVLFVCVAVYLNWNYPDGTADTGKTLGEAALVGGQAQDPLLDGEQTGEQGEQSQDGLKKWMPFVRLAWELLGDLRRKLVVDRLVFRLVLADPDPCDLAVNYGRVLALKESLLPMLERVLEIRSREIDIRCDFAAEKPELTARADLVLTLGRAAVLAAVYGVRALKEYRNLKNNPKGGA